MENDNFKQTTSTNKHITLVSNKKNKIRKHQNAYQSLGIDTVFNDIVSNKSYIHNKESLNECQTYYDHVHSISHDNDIYNLYMNHSKQVQLINILYLNYEIILLEKGSNALHKKFDLKLYTLLDDIKSKVHGYKRQDIKKRHWNQNLHVVRRN